MGSSKSGNYTKGNRPGRHKVDPAKKINKQIRVSEETLNKLKEIAKSPNKAISYLLNLYEEDLKL